MNWKTPLTAAALLCSLAPAAAFADHWDDHDAAPVRVNMNVDVPPFNVNVQTGPDCHHGMPPSPPNGVPVQQPPSPPAQIGHYELRTVNEYVPGRYDQVWVPPSCFYRGHGRWGRQVCSAGYYTQQWIPERYVATQKWIWVNDGYAQAWGGGPYAGQR